MAINQSGLLAREELTAQLRQERVRLQWRLYQLPTSGRAPFSSDDSIRDASLLALEYAVLDRLNEIEYLLAQLAQDRLDRCQGCGSWLDLESLRQCGAGTSWCRGCGEADAVSPRQVVLALA